MIHVKIKPTWCFTFNMEECREHLKALVQLGWILSPVMWFVHVWDNRSCQILSVNGACPSLVICAVPPSVKTTPELSGPAFGVLPETGDEELEDRGKPGWERLRMICARSTLAWRRQNGALWIDRHGVYSWLRLHPRNMLQRERERETESAAGWVIGGSVELKTVCPKSNGRPVIALRCQQLVLVSAPLCTVNRCCSGFPLSGCI